MGEETTSETCMNLLNVLRSSGFGVSLDESLSIDLRRSLFESNPTIRRSHFLHVREYIRCCRVNERACITNISNIQKHEMSLPDMKFSECCCMITIT